MTESVVVGLCGTRSFINLRLLKGIIPLLFWCSSVQDIMPHPKVSSSMEPALWSFQTPWLKLI